MNTGSVPIEYQTDPSDTTRPGSDAISNEVGSSITDRFSATYSNGTKTVDTSALSAHARSDDFEQPVKEQDVVTQVDVVEKHEVDSPSSTTLSSDIVVSGDITNANLQTASEINSKLTINNPVLGSDVPDVPINTAASAKETVSTSNTLANNSSNKAASNDSELSKVAKAREYLEQDVKELDQLRAEMQEVEALIANGGGNSVESDTHSHEAETHEAGNKPGTAKDKSQSVSVGVGAGESWWEVLLDTVGVWFHKVTGKIEENDAEKKGWVKSSTVYDADRKELDDRFNYAGFDVGARVLQAHRSTIGARNILLAEPDVYMTSPCSLKKKWVVVQLAEPLLIEKLSLANHEQYSSTFRHFQVLGSPVYPVNAPTGPGAWRLIGNFIAQDSRFAQDFSLKTPQWAKYLKIRFLSHYGTDYFCTVSSLKVFGTNMLEDMAKDEAPQSVDDVAEAVAAAAAAMSREANVAVAHASSSPSNEVVTDASLSRTFFTGSNSIGDRRQPGVQNANMIIQDRGTCTPHWYEAKHSGLNTCIPFEEKWVIHAEGGQAIQSSSDERLPHYDTNNYAINGDSAVADAVVQARLVAQAQALLGAQSTDAVENPFRAMTNKIKVLELNHSATVLMVEHLSAQTAALLAEVQRTQAAREETIAMAENLLSNHAEQMRKSYGELRQSVQHDAAEIFRHVHEAVSAQVVTNMSTSLAELELMHQVSLQAMTAKVDQLTAMVVFAFSLSLIQFLSCILCPPTAGNANGNSVYTTPAALRRSFSSRSSLRMTSSTEVSSSDESDKPLVTASSSSETSRKGGSRTRERYRRKSNDEQLSSSRALSPFRQVNPLVKSRTDGDIKSWLHDKLDEFTGSSDLDMPLKNHDG